MNITKEKLYDVVFESDTKAGKSFDILLLIIISISIVAVMLESVEAINKHYAFVFKVVEWIVTFIFTAEYLLRIGIVKKPLSYVFSFYGIIDLLSIMPTYFAFFISGAHGLVVIRALRLLRVFRILKLNRHVSESTLIITALKASRAKIIVFLYAIVMIVIIIGTVMYLVEGSENGFTSIPRSIYWAIVTLTTVGFGDIVPKTYYGQFIASFVMILGYAIIAVPTGIVTAEISTAKKKVTDNRVCSQCLNEGHDIDAKNCKYCGAKLDQ